MILPLGVFLPEGHEGGVPWRHRFPTHESGQGCRVSESGSKFRLLLPPKTGVRGSRMPSKFNFLPKIERINAHVTAHIVHIVQARMNEDFPGGRSEIRDRPATRL